ncbi:adenylyl cyclase-associated protein [Microdochium nivale]|nr:adenylyl cyclase-associated protein [Microdochium nivale]
MAANNSMHNLTTLIKRLEAATSRLEDIASSTTAQPQSASAAPNISSLSSAPPAASATPTQQPAPAEELPESIEEFDSFIASSVQKYVDASNKIGGAVAEQAAKVLEGFKQQRAFLVITTKAKKPNMDTEADLYQKLIKPIQENLVAAADFKEANRGSPDFDQLSTVAEGIMVLAWVTLDTKPFKHVDESLGAAQFFGNRVLKAHKDKNPDQVAWIQSFYQMFRDLSEYVKQFYANGIPWNPKGPSATELANSDSSAGSAAAPPPAAGGAPPPPPPGPPPVLKIKEQAAPPAAGSGGLGAVFSELNKGDAVTKGLRKVDKSEMTHKNPALRAASGSGDSSVRGKSPAPGKKPKPESMRAKKPPKMELDGSKWIIENYEKHATPIEIDAEMSHSVLISRCSQTTIVIKGKANAITIENTQRLSLVIDSLVSTVDAVKSSNFALQVMGTLPTIMLDQLDGAQIYLSKESSSTRVFTSKSSSVNVNVVSGPDDDYKEIPLPYQICSYFDEEKGEMVNEIVEHAG